METKSEVRKRILRQRKLLLSEEQRQYKQETDRKLCKAFLDTEEYKGSEVVLLFVGFDSEINTIPMIEAALQEGKKVFVPRVIGEDMHFFKITSCVQLISGYKGIMEPDIDSYQLERWEPTPEKRCLIVFPGVVFDEEKHRIGYGKGFYDRFMKQITVSSEGDAYIRTLAVAYEMQIEKKIPHEEHDFRPEHILTERRYF